jgi:tetratricopeptide (TPR) repeat protein
MTVHIFKCPKCGIQHEWEKFPPMYCKNCRAVFDIKREPEPPTIWQQNLPSETSNEKNAKKQQFCRNCGIKLRPSAAFCPECGAKLILSNSLTGSPTDNTPISTLKIAVSLIKREEIQTIYDNNAFRILGIAGNVDKKTLRNVQQSSKARVKLGGPINIPDPLGFLNTMERDENLIRDAQNRIEVPKSRILERLFWFLNINQNDAEALEKLNEGRYNDAVQIWTTSEELSASINLAILYHAYYLSKDIDAEKTEKWKRVFERWQNLFNNEKYWQYYATIEQKSEFEPPATDDEFDTVKNNVWKILLQPNIDCIKAAIDKNLDDIAKRHIDLIRTSNNQARIITDVEYEIFSPFEKKIYEDIDEIGKKIFENKNSSRSKSEKKTELDHLFETFNNKNLKEINRFLRIIGIESGISKNIREKTAICLREFSICYHNETESFELSKRILSEAGRIAEGTAIISKINDDYSIISKHAKDAQEFEKYIEYNDTIGKDKLVISKDLIVFKKRRFWMNEISGIRYGIYQESVNGVPTSRSFAIWLKCDNPNSPEKTYPSDYIPPVTPSENVMMIECADATWFGVDKIQNRFNEIVNRLFQLVQIPIVNKMIQDFESGRRMYVSSIIIDFTGIYKDFTYNPLTKGVISLSSKYLGTKDVAAKEGKHKHISWDNYRGYNLNQGRIYLYDDHGSWISFSLRDDWNAVNLSYFFDYMNKDGNLAKSIEKCISGITAVHDEQSEVIKTLDNSLEIDPKNWLTWWQKGRALKNLGRFEEAVASFDQVITLKPKDAEVWNVKGLTLLEMDKESEALDCFERGLAIDSQLSHIWFNKGMTLERLKKYEDSVRALDRSLAIKFDQEIKNTRDRIQSSIS